MGYSPRAEIFDVTSSIPTVALQLRDWKKAREDAQKLMIKAQKKWTKGKELEQRYKTGDQVWLEGHNLQVDRPSVKLAPKRYGPFKIRKVLLPITYQLALPPQWKIHNVFHADLLTPYHETELHRPNFTRPPPDLIDGEEEYKVEEILQSRRFGRGCKVQYLVKWKGYPESDNQWVNWDNLHADEVIADFKKKNPAAISHIKAGGSEAEVNSKSPMSDNDHSSPPLSVISPADMPPEIRQLFLDWRPTVPSSWTTPPESEGDSTAVSTGSSPSDETTINPWILSLPICHSMQHTPRTPPTTPSPMTTTPQRAPSPAPHQKSPTPPPLAQTPYQSRHDHSWRVSTLWDWYIRTQGLTVPDPLYKSSTSRWHVKKPRRYAATPEERHHQELMALLDRPTNGQMLTRGLLGRLMDQDRKSRKGTR